MASKKSKKDKGKGAEEKSQTGITPNKSEQKSGPTGAQVRAVIIGSILVLLIVLLSIGGVWLLLNGRKDYQENSEIPVPKLDPIPEVVNSETIDIKGKATEDSEVILYVNGKPYDEKESVRSNGKFSFRDVPVPNEKEYKFKVAEVRENLLKKERSKFSEEISLMVDRTKPKSIVDLDKFPKSSDKDKLNLSGKLAEGEGGNTVILRRGSKDFEAKSDEKGNFTFEDVLLEAGDNEFEVIVRDPAGNETDPVRVINVFYDDPNVDESSLNGNGVTTKNEGSSEELPDSAGEFLLDPKYMDSFARGLVVAALGGLSLLFVLIVSNVLGVFDLRKSVSR